LIYYGGEYSLSIPLQNFPEAEEKISFDEKMYYKLDLGGDGKSQPYGFSGLLILNKYKHLELIKLEID
jgi:hypothetical protein